MKKVKEKLKQLEFIKLFLILWRHKKKWFVNNSRKLYYHSKEYNQKYFGMLLIAKMIKTEFIFLKEKNESAAEYGYMLPNLGMTEEEIDKKHYKGTYTFEFMNAFTPNINMWLSFFKKRKLLNKNLKYLEIGSFEGRSSVFILENLQNAQCFFVDPFESYEELKRTPGQSNFSKIYNNFLKNIKNFESRTNVYKGTSNSFFNQNQDKFDLIYVDGSHFGEDVYLDAINSFNALNNKGYIIFDDLFFFLFDTIYENPLGGIFKFLVEYKKQLKITYVSNQLIIQKKV